MFHLGWFVGNGYSVDSWRGPWSGVNGREWTQPDLYVDAARSLERAGLDYLIFEDGLMIPDAYQGRIDGYLRFALECPRLDPLMLVSIISQHTRHIGLLPTVSTSFHPPFLAARTLVTLDHLSNGRGGGNLVTSSSHRAAQNFGHPHHFEHDLRYRMADEWAEVVTQLWDSWDPEAVVADQANDVWADGSKVHEIDFAGEFFRSRGPLNAPPGPQGRPVISQAGGSPAGREFAARWADTILSVPLGVEAMKAYRDDISARMVGHDRKPSDCKVMYLVDPVLAESDEAAHDKLARRKSARRSEGSLQRALLTMSYFSGLDFSAFDLDEPLPDLTGTVNGHQSSMTRYAEDAADGRTLRELATQHDVVESLQLVGSPDTVAGQMAEAMEEVGGDGFLIASSLDRRNVASIADGLVPALRKRRLVRDRYSFGTFRENLLEF